MVAWRRTASPTISRAVIGATALLSLVAATAADAGQTTPLNPKVQAPPNVEIVPQFVDVSVNLSFPGRDGDAVFVDGWPAGKLPVQTQLSEGAHTFRIEGATGKFEVELYVPALQNAVTQIDLSVPPPPPEVSAPVPAPAAPKPSAPAPAPAPKPTH